MPEDRDHLALLQGLNEKYKKNSALGLQDAQMYAESVEQVSLYEHDLWDKLFETVLNGPLEAGAAGMADAYLKMDSAQRDAYLRSFIEHEEFQKNQRHKAVYRASILLGKLIQHDCEANALSLLISAIARLLCSNAGEKELSPMGVKYFREGFLLKAYEKPADLNLSSIELDARQASCMQRLIAYAAFAAPHDGISQQFQMYSLKAMSTIGSKLYLKLKDLDMINEALQSWDQAALSEVASLERLPDLKIPKIEPIEPAKIENKEDSRPIDSKVSELLEGLKKYIAEMEDQIVVLSDKAKLYDRLSQELQSERLLNDELRKENDELKSQNQRFLEAEEQRRQDAVKLYEIKAIEDSNLLSEFKNKLSAQLKYEYIDFTEVVDAEMTIDIGENLRAQLENIFNILRRNGVLSKEE